MRLALVLSGLPLILGLPALSPASARPTTPLMLNEIMAGPARDWDGSGTFSSRDDEWIEVVNAGSVNLDLAGFFITDGDSIPRFALTGSLPAQGHLVVFGRNAYDWERANGHPAFGLSLANTGDQALLWQVNGADTVLIDSYTYRSHEAAADRAIGRLPDGGAWTLFDGLNPYTGTTPPQGTGCPPTPALSNTCAATSSKPSTWGMIKSLYR